MDDTATGHVLGFVELFRRATKGKNFTSLVHLKLGVQREIQTLDVLCEESEKIARQMIADALKIGVIVRQGDFVRMDCRATSTANVAKGAELESARK